MGRKKRYVVELTKEEQDYLSDLLMSGVQKVRKTKRIQILLKAHDNWTDQHIADALNVGRATSERTRKCYQEYGLEIAINGKKAQREYDRKMDGEAEARLIQIANSKPPAGRDSWTLRLLADNLVSLEEVPFDSIAHETVRRTLKKTNLSLGRRKNG